MLGFPLHPAVSLMVFAKPSNPNSQGFAKEFRRDKDAILPAREQPGVRVGQDWAEVGLASVSGAEVVAVQQHWRRACKLRINVLPPAGRRSQIPTPSSTSSPSITNDIDLLRSAASTIADIGRSSRGRLRKQPIPLAGALYDSMGGRACALDSAASDFWNPIRFSPVLACIGRQSSSRQ
jgi:hypothetical protein